MIDHASIAEQYRRAFYGGDRESLHEILTDDFTFSGPAAAYHGIQKFLSASDHVAGVVRSVETRRVFADGADVCAILSLVVDHKVERLDIVEWYRFRGDRIASVETVFDTGPFVSRAAETATVAIDPVCGMAVEKKTASAVRVHNDTTYYFCNEGCAIAFEEAPEQYVSAQARHDNRRKVIMLFEAFNGGDLEAVEQLVGPDYVGAQGQKGPAGFNDVVVGLRAAFPDLHYTLDDVVAEGDQVAVRWHWTGTHRGAFRGFPATGKAVSNTGAGVFRLQGGRIAAGVLETDRLGFLEQIDAVPEGIGRGPRPSVASRP